MHVQPKKVAKDAQEKSNDFAAKKSSALTAKKNRTFADGFSAHRSASRLNISSVLLLEWNTDIEAKAQSWADNGGYAPPSTRDNNNNNTLLAATPLWGVEACSLPSMRPNPIPAIPPYVVRTPYLHGAPTTEETVKL